MTEQSTTPQPDRPLPRLGRGGRWGAHLDAPIDPVEPYQPKPRTHPAGGWPKTGNVGATARLDDDEEPATVPARPYASPEVAEEEVPQVEPSPTPSLGEAGSSLGVPVDAVECSCSDCRRTVPVAELVRTAPPTFVVREPGWYQFGTPPPAVELRALADDLNSNGGLDETFVAALLQAAAGGSEGGDAPASTLPDFLKPRSLDEVWPFDESAADFVTRTASRMLETAPRPTATVEHQHIWTMTSPARCVECRRYLRPWWRRALARVRRWGR